MNTEGELAPKPYTPDQKKKSGLTDVSGKFTTLIGSGENAQNSFIYLTLKWAYLLALTVEKLFQRPRK